MNPHIRVIYDNVPFDEVLDERVRRGSARLEHAFPDIVACKVTLTRSVFLGSATPRFHVFVDVLASNDRRGTPREIEVDRYAWNQQTALSRAFATMDRRLQERRTDLEAASLCWSWNPR